jgi:hypothetical protein
MIGHVDDLDNPQALTEVKRISPENSEAIIKCRIYNNPYNSINSVPEPKGSMCR